MRAAFAERSEIGSTMDVFVVIVGIIVATALFVTFYARYRRQEIDDDEEAEMLRRG